MNDIFNVEAQFKKYLKLVALDENKISIDQKIVMRDVFFGAFGQVLVLLRDEMPDDEDQAVSLLDDLFKQCGDYWEHRLDEKEEISNGL